MFVYVITNTVNGKRYVGKGCVPAKRWTQHKVDAKRGHETPLCRSIRKHGAEAFTFEVVQECATEAESYDAERAWIAKLDSTVLGNGYNQTGGGEGLSQCLPATRARMSAARAGKPRPAAEVDARAKAIRGNGKKAAVMARAVEMHAKGWTLAEIARELDRTGTRIGQLLAEAGVRQTTARDASKTAEQKERIRGLRDIGYSFGAIAKTVGVSIGWVHRVCVAGKFAVSATP